MPDDNAPRSANNVYVLRSLHPPVVEFRLAQRVVTVGRSRRCGLVVLDRSVSREHAEICVSSTGLHVTDLDSSNGTFVDNQRIRSCALDRGQTVKFGNVAFLADVEDQSKWTQEEETDSAKADRGTTLNGDALAHLRSRLTKAQVLVFDLVVAGSSEKAVASRLDLSPHTVHNHIKAIFRAFDVHSRGELMASVIQACRPPEQ